MKLKLMIMLMVLLIPLARAEWVQPLDCQDLFNNELNPTDDFQEPADICFYGTGYAGDVDVSLVSDGNTYVIEDVETSNGVLSSITGGVNSFFTDVVGGLYDLIVNDGDQTTEYGNKVTVQGSTQTTDVDGPTDENLDGEVPEFGTLAAVGMLVIAGLYIQRTRKSK